MLTDERSSEGDWHPPSFAKASVGPGSIAGATKPALAASAYPGDDP